MVADNEEPYIWDHFDRDRFTDVGLILSCGDLKAEYLSYLVTMIKAPLFYVPGNHNESYQKKPPEGCESIDGRLVRYQGIRLLGLGGSQCYSRGLHQYTDRQMDRRILKLKPALWRNKGFDILVTHAPALNQGDGQDLCHKGFSGFLKLMDRYSPRYFVHGHQHMSYGRQPRVRQYGSTTIINAF